MTRVGVQSLAAALAAFVAVTPFAGRDDTGQPETRLVVARTEPQLAGVGMPNTGPGNIPLEPLTVIVHVTGTAETKTTQAEIGRFGEWLNTHHGRARLALINGHRATALVEPFVIVTAPTTWKIRSLLSFARRTFTARKGQRLLISIGPKAPMKAAGAALLWLPMRNGAPVVDVVALHDHEAARQPVDGRRRGVIAATAARAVISLTHLREVKPGAQR